MLCLCRCFLTLLWYVFLFWLECLGKKYTGSSTSYLRWGWLGRSAARMNEVLVGWLVGWLVDWLVGWLVGSLVHGVWLRFDGLLGLLVRVLMWLAHEILKLVWPDPNSWNFPITGKTFVNWSWAWFFWRPLQEGNFEFFLATLQLDQTFKPIWFCSCNIICLTWYEKESKLQHMRFWVILNQLQITGKSFAKKKLSVIFLEASPRW